ncbi:MAG: hypothetical protein MUE73_00925 [Planctomycetes bacterium]|nr:hypothetical protein [Planctomycetota bacterium]
MGFMDHGAALAMRVRELTDRYRSRCLWFLREDHYPVSTEEILRVLGWIERHGDREAYRLAAELREWLSRNSSAPSVV